jgi:hypothetical protein
MRGNRPSFLHPLNWLNSGTKGKQMTELQAWIVMAELSAIIGILLAMR